MKIRMHYVYGKKNTVACGMKGGFITHNFREITCKRCLKTFAHRDVVSKMKQP